MEAWLAYIQFERFVVAYLWNQLLPLTSWIRSVGDVKKCESLFKRAIAKQPDDPERLMHAWLNMEHEVGSLTSMQDALVRINKKTKMLTQQWQVRGTKGTFLSNEWMDLCIFVLGCLCNGRSQTRTRMGKSTQRKGWFTTMMYGVMN